MLKSTLENSQPNSKSAPTKSPGPGDDYHIMQRLRKQYLNTAPWQSHPGTSPPRIPHQEDHQVGEKYETHQNRVSEASDVSKHGTNLLLTGPLLRRELLQQETGERDPPREEHEEKGDGSPASLLTAARRASAATTPTLRGGASSIPTLQRATTTKKKKKHEIHRSKP